MADLFAVAGFALVSLIGVERWWECRADEADRSRQKASRRG